jgi:hypothetical protein
MHGQGGNRGTSIILPQVSVGCFSEYSSPNVAQTSNKTNIAQSVLIPAGVKSFSREEIIAFGGIPEMGVQGARSSARIGAQANADDTQMERAMYAAQCRQTVVPGMQTNKSPSFLSFSPNHIIRTANSLGVSLGGTTSEAIASAKIILDNELTRSITMLRISEEN